MNYSAELPTFSKAEGAKIETGYTMAATGRPEPAIWAGIGNHADDWPGALIAVSAMATHTACSA